MSYDINILVLQQEKPSEYTAETIEIKNEYQQKLRYYGIWSYMTQSKGVWYSLGKTVDGIFNAFSICKSDYSVEDKDISIPYWVDDEDVKYHLTPLIIDELYYNDFISTIKSLIDQSPIKTLMFLARYQSGENEIICGVLSLEEFTKLLNKKKILFNTCYIIRQ